MKALALVLLLAGCVTPPPADPVARQACNAETMRAHRAGLSDLAAGAVFEKCMAERR